MADLKFVASGVCAECGHGQQYHEVTMSVT